MFEPQGRPNHVVLAFPDLPAALSNFPLKPADRHPIERANLGPILGNIGKPALVQPARKNLNPRDLLCPRLRMVLVPPVRRVVRGKRDEHPSAPADASPEPAQHAAGVRHMLHNVTQNYSVEIPIPIQA